MSSISGREPSFPVTRFGVAGYRQSEVDRFLGALRVALEEDPPAITAASVARSGFHVGRFGRCYAMTAVDDYLNEVEEALRSRGADGVEGVHGAGGRAAEQRDRRHHSTWWVYGIAAVLIALIVAFVLTQL